MGFPNLRSSFYGRYVFYFGSKSSFSGGLGGIKFEFRWGVSSFSGRVGGIKFGFWWVGGFNCADWTVHLSD